MTDRQTLVFIIYMLVCAIPIGVALWILHR